MRAESHGARAATGRAPPHRGAARGGERLMDSRRHTLLVVDDEVDVLESLRHLFHRSYRVITASSGDQALDLIRKNDVHLILSDQRMPGMSGDVFLSHTRK